MPKITEATVRRDRRDGTDDPCGPYQALLFSDTCGLSQFGAFVEVLPPGSRSSVKHWHRTEDEMVYVLAGTVTLHGGDTVCDLHPGEVATFRAGDPLGHCLENRSGAEVRYLVIGTRSAGDTVTYPDADRRMEVRRGVTGRVWTTLDGTPKQGF